MPSAESIVSIKASQDEAVIQIPLSELYPFPNHPFKVRNDEAMREMLKSVSQYGVLTPAIVRPREAGGYEIIAGHRRKHASEAAGLETLPAIVREMDDDAATILMVDSNIQRENILPSEKAQAYKMKLEAIKRRAGRPAKETENNSPNFSANFRSDDEIGAAMGVSGDTIRNYISLTLLIPELQQMVDDKKIAVTPAYQITALKPEEQVLLVEAIDQEQAVPTLVQAQQLKKASQRGELDRDAILSILSAEVFPSPVGRPSAPPSRELEPPKAPKPAQPRVQEADPPPDISGTQPKRERKSRIAEDILQLKDTTKECRCTPEIFLSTFENYVNRICREMAVFKIPFYEQVFPALRTEYKSDFRRQIDTIRTAAEKFYNDVTGTSLIEPGADNG